MSRISFTQTKMNPPSLPPSVVTPSSGTSGTTTSSRRLLLRAGVTREPPHFATHLLARVFTDGINCVTNSFGSFFPRKEIKLSTPFSSSSVQRYHFQKPYAPANTLKEQFQCHREQILRRRGDVDGTGEIVRVE